MFNSQLKKVVQFARLMGIEKGNQQHIDLYVDLLQEEFNEFRLATRASDEIEIRDGLADIWVIAAQLNMLCGWQSNSFYRMVEFTEIGSGFEELSYVLSCNAKGIGPENYCVNDVVGWCEKYSKCNGYNLVNDLDEVMRSNLSKFCDDELIMSESLDHWKSEGVNVYGKKIHGKYAIYAGEGNGSDYPAGKLMKPLHYQKPNLAGIK